MLYWLILIAQRLSSVLPRRARWFLGALIAQGIYWVWAEKRHATQFNMSIVLGRPTTDPLVRRTARLSWRNYGYYVGDLFDMPNHPPSFYIEHLKDLTPAPHDPTGKLGAFVFVDEARAAQHGVMLTTGHYGNYDVAGMLIASHTSMYALAEALPDAKANELLQEQRRKIGITVVSVEESLRPMMRHLRDNGIVATPIDRALPAGEGVPVQFFGRTAYVPRGLGAVVAKTGAAICPGFVYFAYNDQAQPFRARVFPPVTIEKSGNEQTDVLRATQVMFDALEVMVREDPTQWYMFRRFWPETENPAQTPPNVTTLAKVGSSQPPHA